KVKSGDTLAKIAIANKPDGINLDQMLVALFRRNESEFDRGNMNRLRAGKILSIPSAEEVSAVTSTEARKIVVAQARDFNAYRAKLAAAVAVTPAKKDAARQDDQGWIAPKVVEKPLTTEQKQDELKVSTTQASKDAKAQPGLEEDLVSRDRALQEERDRTAQLEKNIADLQKLAELQKSQADAEAQRQAETAKVDEVKPEPVVAATAETTQADTQGIIPPVQVATETIQPPVPTAKPDIEPEPVIESGDDSDNSLLIYGGIAALLVLALLGYFVFRRKADGDALSTGEFLSDSELMANSVFGATGGQTVDTSASIQTDFSQATLSAAIDGTEEAVDPIMEADLYIALKQETQAEEILVDALKGDPSRLSLYLKLLEIYSGQRNAVKFQKIAKDLKIQTNGAGPEWNMAVAMGRDLDPGNSLYGGGDYAAEVPVAVPSRLTEAAEPVTANFGFKPPVSSSATALNLDIGAPAVSAPLKMPDIDLSLPEEPVAATSDIPMVTQSVTAAGESDFDFDLDAPASDLAAASRESAGDFSRIDLDLADSSSPASAASAFVSAGAPASADGDATDISTKLELAQAYEEMGEREGQRELLEEILREGNPEQREFARAKLAALGA
ncbi:MAG: hypothetical protein LBP94_04010, partial [Zoogloeaceae bacterium]|nr:hypothetical protein [Zoogloeaceae bacterium]